MPISLNRFTSEVLNQNSFSGEGGLAKGSHFEVRISFPSKIDANIGGGGAALPGLPTQVLDVVPSVASPRTTETLSLRCDSISFPSRAPLTTDVKYFGPTTKRIYGYDAAPITATIILSQNMIEREMMLMWQDIAVGSARRSRLTDASAFLVGYYSDYTMPIKIVKYNESGLKTHETTLVEAYPQFVGEVGVDWGNDDMLKVNVTFAYKNFTDKPKGGIAPDGRLVSLFQAALNGNLEREAGEVLGDIIDTNTRSLF